MFPLCLTAILAAAPIPKTAYEGSIALLISKPEPGLLILSPTGEELKRVSLKELKGRVESVRLGRNNSCAFILTTETVDEEKKKYIYRGYFIDLIGKTTPKIVIQKDYSFSWVINRDATLAYGSEGDPKVVMEPHEVQPQLHWQLDLKSGKVQKIDLPANHAIIDIAHDDDSLLTMHWPGKTYAEDIRAVVYSVKTWKPLFLSTEYQNPRSISPEGKYIVTTSKPKKIGISLVHPMFILDTKTQKDVQLVDPEKCEPFCPFSFGSNNRIVNIIETRADPTSTIYKQRVYVMHIDGSKNQLIYEPKNGELITDCDWR